MSGSYLYKDIRDKYKNINDIYRTFLLRDIKQKYKIKYRSTENGRYNGVGFGYGNKSIINISDNPGPGNYNLPSCFDMKRKKVPLN